MSAFTTSRLLFLSLSVVSVLVAPGGRAEGQTPDVDAGKKEAKVVVYGTVVPQVMGVIQRGFEGKYGIKIEYWRADATKVSDRALTEWRAGRPGFDVVIGARGSMLLLKDEGVFVRYVPPSSEKFPAKFKDKDGLLTAWRVTPVGVLYNTDLVKSAEVPKSFDDLLDPKWAKKIAMPDPSQHSSTAQFLWNLDKVKGERWLEYVKALARQEPHLISSYAPIPATIVKGETLLGITYVQYVAQQKGPIGYAPIGRYLADPNDIGLSAKATNPNAAKVFIEFLCSPEGQRRVAEAGEFVLYPGIYPTIKDADKVSAGMIFMDNPSVEQLKKLRADFRQIFFAK